MVVNLTQSKVSSSSSESNASKTTLCVTGLSINNKNKKSQVRIIKRYLNYDNIKLSTDNKVLSH